MDHTLRLYANPLKEALVLPIALAFVAVGVLMMRYAHLTPAGLFVLTLGIVDVAFFGLGGVTLLVSILRHLVRPRPVLRIDAKGWTYTPTNLSWTAHTDWQSISRVAIQCQRVRWRRRFLLIVEGKAQDAVGANEPTAEDSTPRPPESVVMYLALNDIFLRTSPRKASRLLERIQLEFAGELDRYGVTVASTIEDI
jgi:hypothetical protein